MSCELAVPLIQGGLCLTQIFQVVLYLFDCNRLSFYWYVLVHVHVHQQTALHSVRGIAAVCSAQWQLSPNGAFCFRWDDGVLGRSAAGTNHRRRLQRPHVVIRRPAVAPLVKTRASSPTNYNCSSLTFYFWLQVFFISWIKTIAIECYARTCTWSLLHDSCDILSHCPVFMSRKVCWSILLGFECSYTCTHM